MLTAENWKKGGWMKLEGKKIAVLLAEGFEDLE